VAAVSSATLVISVGGTRRAECNLLRRGHSVRTSFGDSFERLIAFLVALISPSQHGMARDLPLPDRALEGATISSCS
jgi:hypothetical protein